MGAEAFYGDMGPRGGALVIKDPKKRRVRSFSTHRLLGGFSRRLLQRILGRGPWLPTTEKKTD